MASDLTPRQELFVAFYRDRLLAHRVIFAHRHPNADPPFKDQMILDWYSGDQYLCELAFRGSTKSTTAEEAICLMALFREFKNCIIFGASAPLAEQRLHAVRRELERNAIIHKVFGNPRGHPWGDDRLELANGVVIRAMGRGQAVRGTKEEVERPDFVFFDDVEDTVSVSTPKGREKVQSWVFGEVIPAMADPSIVKVRVAANALNPESLAMKLKERGSGFKVRTTPWAYQDDKGVWCSSWPERYPMDHINKVRGRMYAIGRGQDYESEYMCDPTSPESRPFKQDMFLVEPTVRTWQAVYSMTDPARTKGKNSADTGMAVWSWIGPRLVVWESSARQLMPDQIIAGLFEVNDRYQPVHVGIEEDGLNEFLLQPIRQEQLRRGTVLPLKPMKAPNGKIDFIKGLQPYFKAREVVFNGEQTDLKMQLLGFPTGKIDAPNALAYALKMRPGAPVYEDFRGNRHVGEELTPSAGRPVWLCLNASRGLVTGIIVQVIDGSIRIFGDFVREGDAGEVVGDIIGESNLYSGRLVQVITGPKHADRYNNVGLNQALNKLQVVYRVGVSPDKGRVFIRNLLQRERQGMPMFLSSSSARWTLNGFSGGYSRVLNRQGVLSEDAEDGAYRTLIEGLESFAGLLSLGSTDEEDGDRLNAITKDGRRYTSMLGPR